MIVLRSWIWDFNKYLYLYCKFSNFDFILLRSQLWKFVIIISLRAEFSHAKSLKFSNDSTFSWMTSRCNSLRCLLSSLFSSIASSLIKHSLMVNELSVPISSWDLIEIFPPRLSVSFLDIVSPRPVPLLFSLRLCLLIVPNNWKRLGISLFAIPTPVSTTLKAKNWVLWRWCSSETSFLLTSKVIPPRWVNLYAFEIRFIRICLIRPRSEQNMLFFNLSLMSTLKKILFWAHWKLNIESISSTKVFNWNGLGQRENVPASIFAKSRMSSIRLRSIFEDILQILKNFSFDSSILEFLSEFLMPFGTTSLNFSLKDW